MKKKKKIEKKEKIEKTEKKKPLKKPNLGNGIDEILPVIRYLDSESCFQMKDGTYLDIIQIISKDLMNANENEIEYDVMKYGKFYKMFYEDIKLVTLNFPVNTQIQQSYLKRKISTCKNFFLRSRLEVKLEELRDIEREQTAREFYIMVFSKSPDECRKNIITIRNVLASGNLRMVDILSREKKEAIMFKINNMSTLI